MVLGLGFAEFGDREGGRGGDWMVVGFCVSWGRGRWLPLWDFCGVGFINLRDCFWVLGLFGMLKVRLRLSMEIPCRNIFSFHCICSMVNYL